MLHLASQAIDAKPLSSGDTLGSHFSHWNVNYLKTKHFSLYIWTPSIYALKSMSVPIRDTDALAAVFLCLCVFEKLEMQCGRTLCSFFVPLSSFRSLVLCVSVDTQAWTCTYMCEARAVMLVLLLAFSSPVGQSSIRRDGRLLWRKLWEFSCPGQFVS